MQLVKASNFKAAARPAGRAGLVSTAVRLWPYIWPKDRGDLKLRVVLAVWLMIAAKLATIAVPYAFKWATDALAGERALDKIPLPALLSGVDADGRLWRLAHPDVPVHARTRRALRCGRHERGAAHGDRGLRPYSSIVAALSPRAQDRGLDAHSRARPERDRDDHPHVDADRRADDRRIRLHRRRALLLFRLALRRRRQRDDFRLSRLYNDCDQLAYLHPSLDERERH